MKGYEQEIDLYFELKGFSESSRESYLPRINAFVNFIQDQHKCVEIVTEKEIEAVFISQVQNVGFCPFSLA